MTKINTSLSTFMKIAAVAIVISAFIFGTMYVALNDFSDDVVTYIESNS